jgi:aminocarboxymuconate-semialdehyde decarboxylase
MSAAPRIGPVVDVHAHVLFPQVMHLAGAAGPEMGFRDGVPFFRSGSYVLTNVGFAGTPFSDLNLRLARMDALGIDHQILSPNPLTYFHAQPPEVALAFCRAQNDCMAEAVRAHPDRFSGLAQLPMQAPALATGELARCVGELGLSGVYLGSRIGDMALDDARLTPVWSQLESLDVPAVVHPATLDAEATQAPPGQASRAFDYDIVLGFAADETAAVATLIYGGVLDRHPRLRVHVPHGGGSAPYLKGRIRMGLERRPWGRGLLQRPFDEVWRQLSFDCLVGTPEAIRFLATSEGADRVMLGTNFAGWDQDDGIIARVRALGLPPAQCAAVLGETARQYFRLGQRR